MLKAITVAKNEEKLIGKCIRGVLSQTYQVDSHLVIDDFSTDRTPEITERLNDGRVRLFRAEFPAPQTQTKWRGERIHSLQQLALDMSGNWDYVLVVDADTTIPKDYCRTIIGAMEKDRKLVMAGARYLRTPTKLEVSSSAHVRGSNYIAKRSLYDLFRKRGFNYNNPYGEVLLERYAKALGCEVTAFPTLTAVQGRETTIQGRDLAGGIHEFVISTPLLLMIVNLLRNRSSNDLMLLYGWLWARTHGVRKYFSQIENKNIAAWYMRRWLRGSSKTRS
jgi:glycosyltransferase involved in cell wall biosynthesis